MAVHKPVAAPWEGAGAGLVLFFVGAVAAHIRARVYYNIAFPGGYLAMAAAALALAVAR